MPDREVLPDEVLDTIASKVGARLAAAVAVFPPGAVPIGWAKTAKALRDAAEIGGEQLKMGDTFPVYALDASALLRATRLARAGKANTALAPSDQVLRPASSICTLRRDRRRT